MRDDREYCVVCGSDQHHGDEHHPLFADPYDEGSRPMTDPVPLTAEDEAMLRALAFDGDGTVLFATSEVRALFATLDRDRSTPSVDGLREAALRASLWLERQGRHVDGCPGEWEDGGCECDFLGVAGALSDALAATPTPAPEPRD